MEDWYTEVDEKCNFSQGEIIFKCPVINFSGESNNDDDGEGTIELEATMMEKNVIVLTQACDIENHKVDNILLAEVIFNPSKGDAKDANKGRMPRYHLLNKKESGELIINDYMIVDFSNVFTLPFNFFESKIKSLGKRIRLNSPYIEYVSQRFGAYYSRIGLPRSISESDIDKHYTK